MELDADIGKDHGRHPSGCTQYDRDRDGRQRRLAGRLSGCGHHAVPRRERSPFEGGWRVPGLMWWPTTSQPVRSFDEMMSHIDSWATLAAMAG